MREFLVHFIVNLLFCNFDDEMVFMTVIAVPRAAEVKEKEPGDSNYRPGYFRKEGGSRCCIVYWLQVIENPEIGLDVSAPL